MQTNSYLIANNSDAKEIPMLDYKAGMALPPLPNNSKTELGFVTEKALISFGTLIICIVVICLGLLIFKKRTPTQQTIGYKGPTKKYQNKNGNSEIVESEEPTQLSTPANLTKCIRTFLENTKGL